MPTLRAWAAVLLALGFLLTPAMAWAQAPGVVVEGTADGRARLVVSGGGPVEVLVGGQSQPITTTPLVSERTAMALVVDASADGGPGLQAGLSGLVDFGLAAPPSTRAALVADTSPPAVVAPLQPGPAGVLTGLSGIAPRGDRQTAAALDLAVAQLPREPDGPRLVVLYTGGADTAEPADDLAGRLRADGVVLAVVTTAADGYWRTVADGTGGVAVAAGQAGVVGAFGQVAGALRARSLVTLPAPERSSTPAVVRVGGQSADTVLPPAGTGADPVLLVAGVVLGVVVLALGTSAVVWFLRRRPVRNAHEWAASAEQRPSTTPIERARAAPPVRRGGRRPRRVWHAPERTAAPSVDRARLRRAIEDALGRNGQAVVRAADGRAGVGVTTAMVEFAHHYREAYDTVWWIAAQDPQLVSDQVARLAEALGVAAPTDPADEAVAAALAALRQRKRWLLVFDDAGSPHDLARFLPDGPGHVLVGSADPEWGGPPVAVPPFTRAESVELLRARSDGLTAADADRVAAALGDLPLDVAAAAATLATTGMGAAEFLAAATVGPQAPSTPNGRVQANPPAAPNGRSAPNSAAPSAAPTEPGAGQAAPNGVVGPGVAAGAWAVAFDRLAADDPPAMALLTLVAWLGTEPVPTALLTGHADRLPASLAPPNAVELAAILARRGLAQADGEGVQLHRVPAAHLVRRTADERPDGAGWPVWAVRLLRAAVPPDPDDPASWPTWRLLLPHVLAATDPGRALDDVAAEVGWLLHHAARFLRARGEQESARALLEDAHDLYRRRLGPDHPETRTAAHALADNLRALGRADQANRVLDGLKE